MMSNEDLINNSKVEQLIGKLMLSNLQMETTIALQTAELEDLKSQQKQEAENEG